MEPRRTGPRSAGRGWDALRPDPSPFTTPLLGDTATMLGVYVKRCDPGAAPAWVSISSTPFALFAPTEQASGGRYSYAGAFNASLPGTRMDPAYECGGHDVTIPTLIGPQTLKTGGIVTFA